MKEIKLKPCPFCGGEAVLITESVKEYNSYVPGANVKCRACGCNTGAYIDFTAPRSAINAWNRRAEENLLIIPEMSDDDIQKAIDFIKNSRPQIIADDKSEAWISVEDRLPDEPGLYLIVCEGKVKAAYRQANLIFGVYWNNDMHGGFSIIPESKVTHWMPLPEAPKMKGGE